ncbi:MAG: hypothetical protein QF578_20615 [Alphaproteobacteria bacterium]|nr:hypothetical protein [Alphaproteobacteria bacterium]MDP6567244.1 hypothetical protein [Alphaproteobacteria bacterium]MDP6812928.1 hypothetical protein [Alphaproteobacteria bacterium]
MDASHEGEMHLIRKHLHLEDIPKMAGTQRLTELLTFWMQSRNDGDVPDWLPPEALNKIGVLGDVSVVDTTAPSSVGYWFRIWGSNLYFLGGREMTGKPLYDQDNVTYANAMLDDYATVVYTGWPRFQFIHFSTQVGLSNRYRLLLPLSSNGYEIDKVVAATQYVRAQLV